MIEPTGIAFPHVIRNEVELMNFGEEVKIAPLVTLIDGSRFKQLMKEVKEFAMRQIIDAEILGINKVDLIEPIRIPILELGSAVKSKSQRSFGVFSKIHRREV
jgi:G3E family GTPase